VKRFTLSKETDILYRKCASLDWYPFSPGRPFRVSGTKVYDQLAACIRRDFPQVDAVSWHGTVHALENLVSRGPHRGWPNGNEDEPSRLDESHEVTQSDVEFLFEVVDAGDEWLAKATALVRQCAIEHGNAEQFTSKEDALRHATRYTRYLQRCRVLGEKERAKILSRWAECSPL